MAQTSFKELLDAGVHLGHVTHRWNPKMASYIFMERNGIHILDLNKTSQKIDEASKAIRHLAKTGRKILFIGTKKQAKNIVKKYAVKTGMPYVTERWLGGMLTNFATVRKSIKKMLNIEKFTREPSYQNLSKKEKLMIKRNHDNLQVILEGISDLNRIPIAVFIVDVKKEHIAYSEALKLNIPVFAIVDTNSDPTYVDYPIPANDESTKSIELIVKLMAEEVQNGLDERKQNKEEGEANKVLEEKTEEVKMEEKQSKDEKPKEKKTQEKKTKTTKTKSAKKEDDVKEKKEKKSSEQTASTKKTKEE